ncbi:tRNA 2-selenouridine(34) synthase MnmH [Myxococcota bacterium]|nr:tRNA 2-selenouridine(34) synthase MnmH [Myxococcota bacterium]
MATLPLTSDYRAIVLKRLPMIDVRAPVEFLKGAFPGAVNLPLMDDRERHLVGTAYKRQGHDAAVELGYSLVSGAIKDGRIADWAAFYQENPRAVIYCFRGGMRSRVSQEWLTQACGKEIDRLEGGYKAFRAYLSGELTKERPALSPVIVGGRTGSGKTKILKDLPNFIDLEALANHRGSSFGRRISEQPTQINFEHALAYALIHHEAAGHERLILEDEGNHIGQCYVTPPVRSHLYNGPLVILETPLEERVQNILDEYVHVDQKEYCFAADPVEGIDRWMASMAESLTRIHKRLGGVGHDRILSLIQNAVAHQKATGDTAVHAQWIRPLLTDYYDPMYDYQIQQRLRTVTLTGDARTILDFVSPA